MTIVGARFSRDTVNHKPQTCLWLARQTVEYRSGPLRRSLVGADGLEGSKMLITLMLGCAILASLALGVLAAYAVCLGFFRVMAGRTVAAIHAASAPAKAEI